MKKKIIAYKLFRKKRNGSLGSLFINRRQDIPVGTWLDAEPHETKGFAFRPGWHACGKPCAPHLSMKGRTWFKVMIDDYDEMHRPESQGGLWYIARRIKVISEEPRRLVGDWTWSFIEDQNEELMRSVGFDDELIPITENELIKERNQ